MAADDPPGAPGLRGDRADHAQYLLFRSAVLGSRTGQRKVEDTAQNGLEAKRVGEQFEFSELLGFF